MIIMILMEFFIPIAPLTFNKLIIQNYRKKGGVQKEITF